MGLKLVLVGILILLTMLLVGLIVVSVILQVA